MASRCILCNRAKKRHQKRAKWFNPTDRTLYEVHDACLKHHLRPALRTTAEPT